jgi:hypothetical protein
VALTAGDWVKARSWSGRSIWVSARATRS